jgi:MFS family permease
MIGLGARITEISWIYVLTIFGLSYAVTDLGLSRNLVLGAIALGAAVELITIPLFGNLSDPMGRRVISPREPAIVVLAFVSECLSDTGSCTVYRLIFSAKCFPHTCAIALLSSPFRSTRDGATSRSCGRRSRDDD